MFTEIKDHFIKPTQNRLVEKEIDESMRLLLQAHTNKEHWQAQVDLHNSKLKRLRATWNDLNKDKDTPK